MFLNIVETADELLVGMLQCIVRIQVVEAGCIDDGKEEIAQLTGRLFFILTFQFCFQLIQLLAHFLPHVGLIFPVEAYVTGFVLNAVGLDERGYRSSRGA